MGSHVMEPASLDAAALRKKLGFRRSKTYTTDAGEVLLLELTAGEAAEVWGELTEAEMTGNGLAGYGALVAIGAHTLDGDRLFNSADEVVHYPARLIVPMAQAIMELSELGLDEGKAQGNPAETSPTV